MKKILLGLFILGTLGMAQSNYEVYVKSGVKISQSEVDRNSKEIENLINKEIIERYNTEGKKAIFEKTAELYNETVNNEINDSINEIPKKQRKIFREFSEKITSIIGRNLINELNNTEISVNEILFSEKSNAKVKILIKSKNLDDFDTNEILDEIQQKTGISDKEFEHIEKINKAKLDKFYEYLESRVKEEMKNTDYNEETLEIETKKVNGKWKLEFDFNTFIDETIKYIENSSNNTDFNE
ncbi:MULTISPECIES: hypothetical protein [Leptotrichia]|uniref:DUF5105 domain-containing protein n=2 Tax=Leptotrichia TaxID=32067 RepID=C9MW93_9FUSO|nr:MULTISPECIES: hypothetical protein [Leptotrichia]EEX74759.1 hypothetical protein GCWU000323_00814 [Leptotrichia hofstadii F0254]BBM45345.1 hypothetical protein JMUB3870_1464 [Leptotrichia trevisanii]